MTRRVKRTSQYELQLQLQDDLFLATPRQAQRNWLLNRVMRETADELQYLDSVTSEMIKGDESPIEMDRAQGALEAIDIMEDWQIPIMQRMADIACESAGDVLEIGVGRYVAADMIQAFDVRSHTIVECNDTVVAEYPAWAKQYPASITTLLHGMWQDKVDELTQYDGILFHTYPLTEAEFVDTVVKGSTFAEHFFSTASALLKPNATFTYLTNEPDSLSRAHQRALFSNFSEFSLSVIDDLQIPENTRDSAWRRQMVVVAARK